MQLSRDLIVHYLGSNKLYLFNNSKAGGKFMQLRCKAAVCYLSLNFFCPIYPSNLRRRLAFPNICQSPNAYHKLPA